ncbi:MAG: hypothetical protein L0H59_18080 [Tomitella sp.]|nr:hypothetical protein [Tomitella sp.]
MPDSTFTVTKNREPILHDSRPTSYGDEPLYLACQAVDDEGIREELRRQVHEKYQGPNGELNLRAGDSWEVAAGNYTISITGH